MFKKIINVLKKVIKMVTAGPIFIFFEIKFMCRKLNYILKNTSGSLTLGLMFLGLGVLILITDLIIWIITGNNIKGTLDESIGIGISAITFFKFFFVLSLPCLLIFFAMKGYEKIPEKYRLIVGITVGSLFCVLVVINGFESNTDSSENNINGGLVASGFVYDERSDKLDVLFLNNSDSVINGFSVSVKAYDIYDKRVGTKNFWTSYTEELTSDVVTKVNDSSISSFYINSTFNQGASKVCISVTKYINENGKIVKIPKSERFWLECNLSTGIPSIKS
jgi:hypothetical protein